MRKLLFFLLLAISIFSCSVKESPIFVKIKSIKVVERTSQQIVVAAEAEFLNPNILGGKIKTDALKVLVNDNEIASITTEQFEVPAQKEFTVPITATIPVDSLFSKKNLSGILGGILNKSAKVQYKGDLVYTAFGISVDYPVDETQEVKFK